VGAGSEHSCGITTAGAVYCWGNNEFGQLGNGNANNSNVPLRVLGQQP
jgi:alpha-tubulin suppressor-like RCC1 family protein